MSRLRSLAERHLLDSLTTTPCACGRTARADVKATGPVEGAEREVLGRRHYHCKVPTICNRCMHREVKGCSVSMDGFEL